MLDGDAECGRVGGGVGGRVGVAVAHGDAEDGDGISRIGRAGVAEPAASRATAGAKQEQDGSHGQAGAHRRFPLVKAGDL